MAGRRIAVIFSLIGLLICAGVMAAVPGKISYQGRLIEDGVPVDTNVDFRFAIYAGATAPTNVWAEAQYDVPVVQGIYNVLLGDSVAIPASVFAGSTTYLEVTVNGEVLSPRQRLNSVPYAMKAQSLPDGAITDVMLAPGAVTSDKILDNTIIGSDIANDALGTDQIQDIYVLNSGDTVTGDLEVRGNMEVGSNETVAGDLAVIGGNIGIGIAPQPSYGIYNDPLTAPLYGAGFSGSGVGLKAYRSDSEATRYALLATDIEGVVGHLENTGTGNGAVGGWFEGYSDSGVDGVYAAAYDTASSGAIGVYSYASSASAYALGGFFSTDSGGNGEHVGVEAYGAGDQSATTYGTYSTAYNSASGDVYGGYFNAQNDGTGIHYALYAESLGSSSNPVYGIFANVYNYGSGNSYAGYFSAPLFGSGNKYGIWASGRTYAAWLQDGKVHIGNDGVENYVYGNGDLFVQNVLEVGGLAHFSGGIDAPGAIDSTDVSFNYAGSASKGGAANDSDLLDGQHAAAFALVSHTHAFSAITGSVTDAQVPDNITITLAQNSSQLNGQAASYYLNATNINAGTLGNSYYNAYNNLSVAGLIDGSTGTDLFTRTFGDSRYSLSSHTHAFSAITGSVTDAQVPDNITITLAQNSSQLNGQAASYYLSATNINAGTLGNSYYNAYNNLSAAGLIDGSTGTDLFTRTFGDGRYVNQWETWASDLTVTGDLTVSGANIGLGTAPVATLGITNNEDSAPTEGAHLFGTKYGVYGANANGSGSPDTHYGYLGYYTGDYADAYGVYGNAGSSSSWAVEFGGNFKAESKNAAIGVQGYGIGYDIYLTAGVFGAGNNSTSTGVVEGGRFQAESTSGTAYGAHAFTLNSGTGKHYGLYAEGRTTSSTQDSTGVLGYGSNGGSGNVYGGYFNADTLGTGNHYGIYATSDLYPGYFAYETDPDNHYTYLGSHYYGIYSITGTTSETGSHYGAILYSYSAYTAYGLYGYASSAGAGYSAYGVYGYGTSSSTGLVYGGRFYAASPGSGDHCGVYGYGYGASGATAYGVYGYAFGGANNYGLYGIGSTYGLYVPAGNKSWVNPDPDDPTKSIAYVTVEAGEAATYYAGRARLENGYANIILPEHFRKVTNPDLPVIATVTPREECLGLMVVQSDNTKMVVKELQGGKSSVEFDFMVKGIRLGYEDYNPIIENRDYVPFQGNMEGLDSSEITSQEWYDEQSDGLKKIFKQNGTLDKNGKVSEKVFKDKGWKLVKEKTASK